MKTPPTLVSAAVLMLLALGLPARDATAASEHRVLATMQQHRDARHENVWEPALSSLPDSDRPTAPQHTTAASTLSTHRGPAIEKIDAITTKTTTGRSTTIPLQYDYGYFGEISIGTPPQTFRMMISTFSFVWIPNFDCGPGNRYYNHSKSSSYVANGTAFDIGLFKGFQSQDTMTIGDFAIKRQGFAEITWFAKSGELDFQWDGMLGLGFDSHDPESPAKMPFHSLVDSGELSEPLFALYLNKDTRTGALTIGATNQSHFTGEIVYEEVIERDSWTTKLGGIHVNGRNMTKFHRVEMTPEIDVIIGPDDEVAALAEAVDAHPTYPGSIEYFIDCSSLAPDIEILIGGARFVLSKSDYTYRSKENGDECKLAMWGVTKNEWMFGLPFMEKVYSVFHWGDPKHDGRGQKIGFALRA